VDVHVVQLDVSERRAAELEAVLSGRERERAARLLSGRHRRRYVVCRAALRQILAARLGVDARALCFELGRHGKPSLRGEGPPFNLSHSHELALIAVLAGAPGAGERSVGVDVELIRRDRDVAALARRFLSAREREQLERLREEELTEAFHWCWTAKEAYLKARGVGLAVPLDSFDVSVDPTAPAALLADRSGAAGSPWTLRRLRAADGFAATVAVSAASCEPRVLRWSPENGLLRGSPSEVSDRVYDASR
jgi:4'-phosphopantetheinyl transferase